MRDGPARKLSAATLSWTTLLVACDTMIAVLSIMYGLILDTVTLGRREMKRMAYLALPAVSRK